MGEMVKRNSAVEKRDNALSLIRIIAAIRVIFGHLVPHMELSCPRWLMSAIGYFSGVSVFFILSGYLIWFSIGRSESYGHYLKKRFFRIYPELWIGVAIEIISILIFYKDWELKSLIAFTFTQGTFLQFWTPDSLRGYGCGTPNGTLWTICAMVQFYLIAWFMHKLLNKKKMPIWIGGFVFLVAVSVLGNLVAEKTDVAIIVKLFGQTIFRYLWLFYIGCFVAEFKDKLIEILSKCWYLFIIIGLVPFLTSTDIFAGYNVFRAIFLGFGVIGFAYRFPKLEIKTDISYGLFIYHMIIANVFISLGLTGKWLYAGAVFAISCIFAYISTVTVGKWASGKKNKAVKL